MTSTMTNEWTFIYALCDPDGTVRYVGKSDDPPRRARQHLKGAASRRVKAWVQTLAPILPTIRVLERVKRQGWPAAERSWIRALRSAGMLNVHHTPRSRTRGPDLLSDYMRQAEKSILEDVLKEQGGSVTAAAEYLGIRRQALDRKLKTHRLHAYAATLRRTPALSDGGVS